MSVGNCRWHHANRERRLSETAMFGCRDYVVKLSELNFRVAVMSEQTLRLPAFWPFYWSGSYYEFSI